MGLGLYPIEDVSGKATQNMGQAAQSYGSMGQKITQTNASPGHTAGGAMGGAMGGAAAGATIGSIVPGIGTAIGAVGGAVIGAAAYLWS
ncbi:MAG: hypothetical protein BA863_17880 [Desulfovibrio sp. S3730MH75]|nr:MAG: hypothetical protein BA863_17880 [Desulfovibrio sp. S3730MH75]